MKFAEQWKDTFGVYSEGADGKIDFSLLGLEEMENDIIQDNGTKGSWEKFTP